MLAFDVDLRVLQCRDHRVHHKNSDKEGDPYNASRGFFYSHVGWLLLKKPPSVREAGKQLCFDDLIAVSGNLILDLSLDSSPKCLALTVFPIYSLLCAHYPCAGSVCPVPTQDGPLVEPVLVLRRTCNLRLL